MADGLKVGGYDKRIDYERLGPTLVIAASVILAIRTARNPKPEGEPMLHNRELEAEIERALKLAQQVLSYATLRYPSYFKHKDVPWWEPDGEDVMF